MILSVLRWLPVLVILVYMAAVVVILLNILIAQMSSTYIEAKKMARLLYDVDRMFIITRLEHSRFHRLVPCFIAVVSLEKRSVEPILKPISRGVGWGIH